MDKKVLFSSKSNNWETPNKLFEKLNNIFNFSLDVCASNKNAKCDKYYTIEDDSLNIQWNGNCWMNPPYGRKISTWIKKAYKESLKSNTFIVCLIPARTDTKYQHDLIFKYAEAVCFIKGRIKFSGNQNNAPFPSQIVVFGKSLNKDEIKQLGQIGYVIDLHNE